MADDRSELVARLTVLDDGALVSAIRDRAYGLVPAPRPPFELGVSPVRPDAYVTAIVGPQTRVVAAWRGPLATGRFAIDARTVVDALLARYAAGPWLRYAGRYVRVVDGMHVGRGEHAALRIANPDLSRLHARFELRDGTWWVHDLGENGTSIRGARIDRAPLGHGEVIALAGVPIEFLATLAPLPVSDDPAGWGARFLTRLELGAIELEPPRFTVERSQRVPALRAARIAWTGPTAHAAIDTRWLFASVDDADVQVDALLGELDPMSEVPAPLVGDSCACFRVGLTSTIVLRAGSLVAHLVVTGAAPELDGLAIRIAARATGFA